MGKIRSALKEVKWIYEPYMALKWKTVLKWKHQKKVKVFHENGYRVLNEIEHELDKADIKSFIAFGTLLGFIRDKEIIPHDDDIDICIVNQGKNEWNILEEVMKKCNMQLTREFFFRDNKVLATYTKDGVNVDFYLFVLEDGKPITYSFWPTDKSRKYEYNDYEDYKVVEYHYPEVNSIHSEIIHDTFLLIPDNNIEILEYLYGQGWKVPDPKFSHVEHAKYIDKVKVVYHI